MGVCSRRRCERGALDDDEHVRVQRAMLLYTLVSCSPLPPQLSQPGGGKPKRPPSRRLARSERLNRAEKLSLSEKIWSPLIVNWSMSLVTG